MDDSKLDGSIVDHYWRLEESVLVANSTKNYDYIEVKEKNGSVKELDNYTVETNMGGWKHLTGSYLSVTSKITNDTENNATLSNNGINDFDVARLYYEEQLIEQIDFLGVATLISNIIHFSGDVSDTSASQLFWYPDTADSSDTSMYSYNGEDKSLKELENVKVKSIVSKIKNNPNFNKGYLERWELTKDGKIITRFIPLTRIFRFARDCDKVLNGKIRIELRKNRVKNILHAKKDGNYEYEISDISLWLPIVKPTISTELSLTEKIANESSIIYGWNAINCYRSNVWTSNSGCYNVVNNLHKISMIYVVFMDAKREDNFTETMMVFDNMNLERIHVKINGEQIPKYEYESNFSPENLDYQRLYSAFLSCNYTQDLDEGTMVNYKNFGTLYPIICFDVTKANDEEIYNKLKTADVSIHWALRNYDNTRYRIFVVVESQRIAKVNVQDDKIYLKTT